MKFLFGGEEFSPAADAEISPLPLLLKLLIHFAKGRLRARCAGHTVLLLREALFPFLFAEGDFGFDHGFVGSCGLFVLRAGSGGKSN
jgi:hypothetical protein